MSEDTLQLTESQYNLLVAARNLDEPAVIEQDSLERVQALFGEVLEREHGLRDGAALPLTAQLDQLEADDEADELLGRQQPETSRPSADELDDEPDEPDDVDPLALLEQADQATRDAVKHDVAKAQSLSSRCPEHSDALRRSALERLGLDPDDSDAIAVLEREIPSDPRLLV